MQFDHMVDFPLDQFEILATGASEVSFIEIDPVRVFEISGEVAGGIGELISFIAN